MAWNMLRGIPGILKIITLIFGLACMVCLVFSCSRPFEPVEWYNISKGSENPKWDNEYEGEQRQVVEDLIVLSFVILFFVLSVAWFVVLIIDKPLKETERRKKIDMGYHLCGGVLLIAMAIMWCVTGAARTFTAEAYNNSANGDSDGHKAVHEAFEKFGYFNLVIHGIDMHHASGSPHGLSLYPHRYDSGMPLISLILTAVFIFLNGGVYVAVAVLLFLNKGVRVIERKFENPKEKIPPMFKERTGILKLLSIVLGIFAVALSGSSYAKPFVEQVGPMEDYEYHTFHSIGEEIAFAIVVIFLVLSIIWLVLYFLDLLKDSVRRKKMDIIYHLVGGIWILYFATILWVVFIYLRTFEYTPYYTKDSMEMAKARNRVHFSNVIVINAPGRSMLLPMKHQHSNDTMKFVHVVLAGIFIFLDGLVYLGLAIYLYRQFRKDRLQVQPEPTTDSDANNLPASTSNTEPPPSSPPPAK